MVELQVASFLVLILGIWLFIPSGQSEGNCPGQHDSGDSCSSVDTTGQLPLAYACLDITYNGKKDDRAPIVVVHGFTAFKEVYLGLAQFLALKTARKVCAVDLRNHGASPWSDEDDSKAMAADLNLFMKTIETDKIVVVGHSLGGKIASEFALSYPDKVEKIVVEDMRPNGLSEEVLKMFSAVEDKYVIKTVPMKIPKGTPECEAKKAAVHLLNAYFENINASLSTSEDFADHLPLECSEDKCKWKSNFDLLDKVWTNPLKYWLESKGKCEKPALFIYGGISEFKIGDVEEEIFELFPNAKMYKIKNGGHILNIHPEYRKEVVNFINAKD